MRYEIEYTDQEGNARFQDVSTFSEARAVAKALAASTGRRATIHQAVGREWRLLLADLETGTLRKMSHRLTKQEAIQLWRKWSELREGAVLIFWPAWAHFRLELRRIA